MNEPAKELGSEWEWERGDLRLAAGGDISPIL